MVYGYLARKTSPWIVTLVTLSFDARYNSCKTGYQSISSTDTLSWKKFSLTYLELQGPKAALLWSSSSWVDFWMELLYWYPIGLCQIKQQKWTMHVLNPTGLNCFCK